MLRANQVKIMILSFILICLLATSLIFTPTEKREFTGKKMDYVYWLKEGHVYYIDDNSRLMPKNGVVNDAFLYLMVGPNQPSTFIEGKTRTINYNFHINIHDHRPKRRGVRIHFKRSLFSC